MGSGLDNAGSSRHPLSITLQFGVGGLRLGAYCFYIFLPFFCSGVWQDKTCAMNRMTGIELIYDFNLKMLKLN